jgi:hypothetical protein
MVSLENRRGRYITHKTRRERETYATSLFVGGVISLIHLDRAISAL